MREALLRVIELSASELDKLHATIEELRNELRERDIQIEAIHRMNDALESQRSEIVARYTMAELNLKAANDKLETAKREITIHEREYQKLLKEVKGAGNE